jgi:hypothetical protein
VIRWLLVFFFLGAPAAAQQVYPPAIISVAPGAEPNAVCITNMRPPNIPQCVPIGYLYASRGLFVPVPSSQGQNDIVLKALFPPAAPPLNTVRLYVTESAGLCSLKVQDPGGNTYTIISGMDCTP